MARAYFVCARCRDRAWPLDDRLGLHHYLSPEARRLGCLAGGSWSFDRASALLREFCGVTVSDECIRRATLGAGAALAAWSESAPEAVGAFPAARGDAEFETDATKVNTTGGWRDAKIGIFVRRPRGAPAATAAWAERVLPRPTARFAFAGVAESRAFAARWGRTAERLGLARDGAGLTVLGDGADWIWNRAAEQFPAAAGVLDVFHAAEHVAAAAQRLFGEGTAAAQAQAQRGRALLLADGYAGLIDWVGAWVGTAVGDGAALGGLLSYFAGHRQRLNYALRLRRGQSIGSGLVEGAAKNLIGRRLKANNARWVEANVNRMAGVVAALYSETWEAYWARN